MIKVESFTDAEGLEYYINLYNLSREDIIDIKWACTGHCTYGLLIYEDDNI